MAVTDRSVTLRTVAQPIESVTHHSVSARTIRCRLQQSGLPIVWSTLDAEPQTSPPPMITRLTATPDQLWQRVEAARSAVPQEHIQSLFESMSRRVAAVISNDGGYSGY
ncbi:hypothetical protein TNCV_3740001 [Trichonephila clavipes]|nr:hypothetical protein TNCV_3740001 [Trichonephila clavipes]